MIPPVQMASIDVSSVVSTRNVRSVVVAASHAVGKYFGVIVAPLQVCVAGLQKPVAHSRSEAQSRHR
jgi:hypothetical protein